MAGNFYNLWVSRCFGGELNYPYGIGNICGSLFRRMKQCFEGEEVNRETSIEGSSGDSLSQYYWHKSLAHHLYGMFSMAMAQANVENEDFSQLVSGSLTDGVSGPRGVFVGVYDGHDRPACSHFVLEKSLQEPSRAIDMSKDHKPDLALERERILEAGGFVHVGRVNGTLSLARAIGHMEFKHNKFLPAEKQIVTCNPDVNVVDITDEDEFLILACDGIWDCMTSQQLVDFIHEQLKTETHLSGICEKVMDHRLAPPSSVHGKGCDNMTMILVQFKKTDQSPIATSSS